MSPNTSINKRPANKARDERVEGGVGGKTRKRRGRLPVAVTTRALIEHRAAGVNGAPIGGIVGTVRVTDGDAAGVRDRVANVVATPVVVGAVVHRLDDVLSVRTVVWLDGSSSG